jgi:phosphatidylserine/phosphatidylglycerophosphate/cardiolipin synthase-like enzyme
MDKGLSATAKATLASAPSHHQKMVLVDYEDPQLAVGFVMGHNMLDEYWDTCKHSYFRFTNRPAEGRNGAYPRQDFSSRVRGPILGDLFANFSEAWAKETGETLPKSQFENYPVAKAGSSDVVIAQLLRTQPQDGVQDIKKLYLQAVNNATQHTIHLHREPVFPLSAAGRGHQGGGEQADWRRARPSQARLAVHVRDHKLQ